jgi:hypothetical protein
MKRQSLARAIVALVEKVLGTGFDPITDDVLVRELNSLLQEKASDRPIIPDPTPDAHLEMAFEDRISGWVD